MPRNPPFFVNSFKLGLTPQLRFYPECDGLNALHSLRRFNTGSPVGRADGEGDSPAKGNTSLGMGLRIYNFSPLFILSVSASSVVCG